MNGYIDIPQSSGGSWRPPVASAANLPATGNNVGDAIITKDTETIYVWNGTSWLAVATPGAAIAIDGLIGDVTATGPGTVVATLATVNSSPGTYGDASHVGQFTVNAKGLVTAAQNDAIQIAESQVTNLISDLAGKQPTGSYITALTGDGTATGPGSVALTLATVNGSPGTTGDASHTSHITTNGKGLVTANTSVSIQIAESQVTNLVSDLAGKQPTGNYITALTGDVTAAGPGSSAATLATVNTGPGTFGSSVSIPQVTINGKGLVTVSTTNTMAFTVFVFQPGGTATANQYTSWASLYANFSATKGTKVIVFDDSIVSPCVMPAGAYDFSNAILSGTGININAGGNQLQLSNGVTWTGTLPYITGTLDITSISTAPIATFTNIQDGVVLFLDNASTIQSTTAEFFKFDNCLFVPFVKTDSSISANGYEVINVINGSLILAYGEEVANIATDTIRGDNTTTLFLFFASASASLSQMQANFAGGIGVTFAELASQVSFSSTTGLGPPRRGAFGVLPGRHPWSPAGTSVREELDHHHQRKEAKRVGAGLTATTGKERRSSKASR